MAAPGLTGTDHPPRGADGWESLPLATAALDDHGRVILWSRGAEAMLGWRAADVLGRSAPSGSGRPPAADYTQPTSGLDLLLTSLTQLSHQDGSTSPRGADAVLPTRDGRPIDALVWMGPLRGRGGGGMVVAFADVTQRRREERDRAARQAHVQRVQKIEAIARLSGGVAHDFNNLLMAIKGNAEMAALEIPDGSPALEDLAEIRSAAARAADLTRQLLAFSRRQVVRPRRLALRESIEALSERLRDAARTDVRLDLDPGSGTVEMDPVQLEQLVLRLVENAGDAVEESGAITLSSRPVELGPEFSRERAYDIPPGAYVNLLVADTGAGMDEATREHAFEPFFTTKEKGTGTGLGLSTAYGIVKQNGGFIEITSSPGAGTEVSILLPRLSDGLPRPALAPTPARELTGGETLLLVEDEPSVLALTRRVLAGRGYRVLAAQGGAEALRLAEAYQGPIHLLVSDVVMPSMSGPQVARALRELRPDVRVLYMSGYNEQVVSGRGVLKPGTAFLGKPFAPGLLLERVREVLEEDRLDPEPR